MFCGKNLHTVHDPWRLPEGKVCNLKDKKPPKGYRGPDFCKHSDKGLILQDNWTVSSLFLDPSWFTIAQVRDPWFRAISMYLDGIRRNKLPGYNSTSIDDFEDFIYNKTMVQQLNAHHTGDVSGYCGLKYLKYDLYIDVDDSSSGFHKLIELRPDLRPALTTGWELCSVNHNPSIIGSKINNYGLSTSTSTYSDKNYIYEKYRVLDKIYCSEKTTLAVLTQYKEDYDILKYMGYKRHECIKHT